MNYFIYNFLPIIFLIILNLIPVAFVIFIIYLIIKIIKKRGRGIDISIVGLVSFLIVIILFQNFIYYKFSLMLKKTLSLPELIQYFENNNEINNKYYENIRKLKEMEDIKEIKNIFKQHDIILDKNIIIPKELLDSLKQYIKYKDELVAKHYRYRILFNYIKGLLIFCVFVLILLKLVLKKK